MTINPFLDRWDGGKTKNLDSITMKKGVTTLYLMEYEKDGRLLCMKSDLVVVGVNPKRLRTTLSLLAGPVSTSNPYDESLFTFIGVCVFVRITVGWGRHHPVVAQHGLHRVSLSCGHHL
jgi:hypothetical protein